MSAKLVTKINVLKLAYQRMSYLLDVIDGKTQQTIASDHNVPVRVVAKRIHEAIYVLGTCYPVLKQKQDWDTMAVIRTTPATWKNHIWSYINSYEFTDELVLLADHVINIAHTQFVDGKFTNPPFTVQYPEKQRESLQWLRAQQEAKLLVMNKPIAGEDVSYTLQTLNGKLHLLGGDLIVVSGHDVHQVRLPVLNFSVTGDALTITPDKIKMDFEPISEEEPEITESQTETVQVETVVEQVTVTQTSTVEEVNSETSVEVEETVPEPTVIEPSPEVIEDPTIEITVDTKRPRKPNKKSLKKESKSDSKTPFITDGVVDNLNITESTFFKNYLLDLVVLTMDWYTKTNRSERRYVVEYKTIVLGGGRGETVENNRSLGLFVNYCQTMGIAVQRVKGVFIVEVDILNPELILSPELTKRLIDSIL